MGITRTKRDVVRCIQHHTILWHTTTPYITPHHTSHHTIPYNFSTSIFFSEDPCANKKCDFYSKCVTTKNNTAVCDCPTICPADWSPVCASDNETYPNLCMMKVRSCENQVELIKVRDGECSK